MDKKTLKEDYKVMLAADKQHRMAARQRGDVRAAARYGKSIAELTEDLKKL